jgi:hypothetical protein
MEANRLQRVDVCETPATVGRCTASHHARKGAAHVRVATWHRTSDGAVASALPSTVCTTKMGDHLETPQKADGSHASDKPVAGTGACQRMSDGVSEASCCPEAEPDGCRGRDGCLDGPAVVAQSGDSIQHVHVAACAPSEKSRKPLFRPRAATSFTARRVPLATHSAAETQTGINQANDMLQSPHNMLHLDVRATSGSPKGNAVPGPDNLLPTVHDSYRQPFAEVQAQGGDSAVRLHCKDAEEQHRSATDIVDGTGHAIHGHQTQKKRKFVPPRTGARA